MSLESVRTFLAQHAPDVPLIVGAASLATVEQAAAGLAVTPPQIAKTMALDLNGRTIVLVLGGVARIDNRKFRDRFGAKPRLIGLDQVEQITGHPVGGVCPLGLAQPLPVFCDQSLREHAEVLPAGGAPDAAIRIAPERLALLAGAEWVDVARRSLPPP